MRTENLLLILASIPMAAQVAPVPSSESKDVVPAFASSGAISLPAARLKVDVTYPNGRKEHCELTVLYHPRTGHYLWRHTEPNPNSTDDTGLWLNVINAHGALAFADPAGLIDFDFPASLFAKAWVGRTNSLDAAVSASINEIQQNLETYEGRLWHMDYKLVPVSGGWPASIHRFRLATNHSHLERSAAHLIGSGVTRFQLDRLDRQAGCRLASRSAQPL
jgi:hypothetical protein